MGFDPRGDNMVADLELLRAQAEDSFDEAGRLRGLYGVTIACSGKRQSLWVGADVPAALTSELTSVFDGAESPSNNPAEPPPALELCRRVLETGGRSVGCKAGPNYLFPQNTQFKSDVHIERSGAAINDALRAANPGNWHPVEWNELLDGRLGPWTMATEGEIVASICHTPRAFTAARAECGVWTHSAFRGRGYGAAVTSEWAAIMRSAGRYLFYSTDAENLSSQRLAGRLGLRPLGWTWRLMIQMDHEESRIHPLSSVRQRQ
jgi:RimJ/RimL family protein N-acetyltransferase